MLRARMVRRAVKNAVTFAEAAFALAAISVIVLRPNGAKIIKEIGDSQARVFRVAFGERIVAARDEAAFATLIETSDAPTISELFAGLSEADLYWVETMLTLGQDPT